MRLTDEELVERLKRVESKLDALLTEHEIEWEDTEPKDPALCMGCGDMDGVAAGYNLLRKLAEFVLLWKSTGITYIGEQRSELLMTRPLNENELHVRVSVGNRHVERVFVLGVMPYMVQASIKQLRDVKTSVGWTSQHRDYRNVLMTEPYMVLFIHELANDLFEEKAHEQAD